MSTSGPIYTVELFVVDQSSKYVYKLLSTNCLNGLSNSIGNTSKIGKNSTHFISKTINDLKYETCLGYVAISSSAPRPIGAPCFSILLTEVEKEQRPSGNGYREAIVFGTGLCDSQGERAYTAYAPK